MRKVKKAKIYHIKLSKRHYEVLCIFLGASLLYSYKNREFLFQHIKINRKSLHPAIKSYIVHHTSTIYDKLITVQPLEDSLKNIHNQYGINISTFKRRKPISFTR